MSEAEKTNENFGKDRPKKKFYQRWWFWVVLVVLVLIIAISAGGNKDNNLNNNAQNNSQQQTIKVKTWKDGQYKVGTDIPAGEYVVLSSGGLSYVEISKDSTGELGSIIANDAYQNRTILTVKEGQYLKLSNSTAYAFSEAPKAEVKNNTLGSGMYKVGVDLPAGEYKVTADEGSSLSYIEVSKDSTHSLNSIVTNDAFSGNKYITVKDGQYLKLQSATLALK